MITEVGKLLKKARTLQKKANEVSFCVYQTLESMGINLDVPTRAENADCLDDAISCYIQYGEFGCKNLILEIQEQMNKEA
jgi:hypothetical protein